ncbi:modulator of DNA gyrase family protein [Neorickettsia helminthoeca str. Oregon]|uniref:Modulator of DNA gyrase family protein n=1 Tax=Neorickettsia helminthoeca str. Oregon TaxID=1286528 RepID=X5HM08_9RICK|nr:TldD/PmbA family protein [Neorickettsia helminthoeca]AHX11470.1 modulator of DNA gyrase family protein [Neorickettsia helminthoeca str. Oregon]
MKTEECITYILNEAHRKNCQADVLVSKIENIIVNTRNLVVEKLEESSFSGLTFRLIKDKRSTSVQCNTSANLKQMFSRALESLEHVPEDQYISLPEHSHHVSNTGNISDNIGIADILKELAIKTEQSAYSEGKLKTTEKIEFEAKTIEKILANTNGFFGTFDTQIFSGAVTVVAEAEGNLNSGFSYLSSNILTDLNPNELGKEAAKRAFEGLKPRKIQTCKREVIFDFRCASNFLSNFGDFLSGASVARSATFLKDQMEQSILPRSISIFNNPLGEQCRIKTSDFDDEGNTTINKLPLVENGVLKRWILDQYNANKLNLPPNGLGKRSLNGSIYPSITNIYLESTDDISEAELISQVKEGLYVTNLFSCGVNPITGDYSQGVQGVWIENGELSFPVSEITIAGKLIDVFKEMVAANNLKFFGRSNSPSLFLGKMMISGI